MVGYAYTQCSKYNQLNIKKIPYAKFIVLSIVFERNEKVNKRDIMNKSV